MLVLGIETSCDETALALVEDGSRIIGTQLASSLPEHQRYGGVVPEIASRAHVELITLELEALLQKARVSPQAVDRIAVTTGPGLSGSLLVGLSAAKALGIAWGKEVVAVNHLQAHLYAALMQQFPWPLETPMIGLVISGGHTALVRMEGISKFVLLGQTRDDAVGEAFDKVAKLLGLGFPGGPEIEQMAKAGDPRAFRFSVPRIKSGSAYDFSLSGIKTAVLYKVQEFQKKTGGSQQKAVSSSKQGILPSEFVADMAASFQQAIVEEVVEKTVAACREHGMHHVAVGGGVIANRTLRERLMEVCARSNIHCAVPAMNLCTDNGAMVAGLGVHLNSVLLHEVAVVPNLPLERCA